MLVDLHRTFSAYTTASRPSDDSDWTEFLGRRPGTLTWEQLHEKPLTIVLGEAGIGKTVEFEREVERLTAVGKPAFFIPLNQLSEISSWELALTGHDAAYAAWTASNEVGYFFLDAVDEARLRSHADFEKALKVVQQCLTRHLTRIRIAISSRITDWSAPSVQSAVDTCLTKPIARAIAASAAPPLQAGQGVSRPLEAAGSGEPVSVNAFAVSLDPLSNAEARRCAQAFSLEDAAQFWAAVADGEYEFMATRPLDLRWMVELWNGRKALGTYLELIEENITNRLSEFNPSYESTGEALSSDELRSGATELAAAAEFSGSAFFTLDASAQPLLGELSPYSVLTDWNPIAVRRLLGTAIFDEASFGRVKFHHRSVREFLAARWMHKQLGLGVPLQRLRGLVAGHPYGSPVVVATRSATLSWLAALNVQARAWVVREFPELLLIDGDPQAWDRLSVDLAFDNYVKLTAEERTTRWSIGAGQYLRIGRALSAGKVGSALTDMTASWQVRRLCYGLAWHAKLVECAPVAFNIYRNAANGPGERRNSLEVLARVGTGEQRRAVLNDLLSGALGTNELIAHALRVAPWPQLTVWELSIVFDATHSEEDGGLGPMARAVSLELAAHADLRASKLLLRSVMTSMPPNAPGKRWSRFPESDRPERAWLLHVLPDCLERVLALLPANQLDDLDDCVEAAVRIEALRNSGFADRADLGRLHEALARQPALRWSIALAIAQAPDMFLGIGRLTLGPASSLVTFDVQDLPELTSRANNSSLRSEERDVWFSVAMSVAFRGLRRRSRASALRALVPAGAAPQRGSLIKATYARWCEDARQSRQWQDDERRRNAETAAATSDFGAKLAGNLVNIQNGTDVASLVALLRFSFSRSRDDYSNVDFDLIARELGRDVASAFEAGLKSYWPTVTPPNPADFSGGEVPWAALLGLAGLRVALTDTAALAALPGGHVDTAAKLAVWALNEPPSWFEPLARIQPLAVTAALMPWVTADAQNLAAGTRLRGALELALRCAPDVRKLLLPSVARLALQGQIERHDIIDALSADGLLPPGALTKLCQAKVAASLGPSGALATTSWLRIWMEVDAPAAWSWFAAHMAAFPGSREAEVSAFAAAMLDLKWIRHPLEQAAADMLVSMHRLCSANLAPSGSDADIFGPPAKRLRDAIVEVLVGTRGPIGHRALDALIPAYSEHDELLWMRGRLKEHASLDLAQSAMFSAAQLKGINSPFLTDPQTEAQLFTQVMARLEEIRKSVEEGPFSERDLFTPNIEEKFLQRWLAAKFQDTQNLRFSIHREEEVDDDKKTDIQLSARTVNVCVEIKPLDVSRKYSANSLTDTLRTQVVGQYLRGYNSSSGILVLMQLDHKTWDIPGGASGQSFDALVGYLQVQADAIKRDTGVSELMVFGIRCIAPER